MKAKDIKKKVAAKVAKGKNKVAKKCGKKTKKVAAVVALLAFAAVLDGCLYPTAPSRSQNLTIRDCDIRIYGGGAETGDVARVEIASQAMAIETSGTENNTNTPTQTTDIKPDVDVNTTGGRTAGILESAISAGAALRDAGRMQTDAALVLRGALADDHVADRRTLAADIANSGHFPVPFV